LHLIIGLGNPGKRYLYTRHNIGYMVIDHIADFLLNKFVSHEAQYKFVETEFSGERAVLLKPMTFMNRSGLAVAAAIRTFSVAEEDLLVISDDLHLPFATLRLRPQGSAGGHNGLRSIIEHLGHQQFSRMRLGIGAPGGEEVSDYVLSDFNREERHAMPDFIAAASQAVNAWVLHPIADVMHQFNRQY
jgi:PTH1 family peptidyl-tRNA hydrolase